MELCNEHPNVTHDVPLSVCGKREILGPHPFALPSGPLAQCREPPKKMSIEMQDQSCCSYKVGNHGIGTSTPLAQPC